ncbi:hypothetical protein R1sor_005949 [Riccia sorocarpa]|uniref:Uncharacterized protein n=1 Tax=Riccia sorocarpa TaxID=122646 RepID=A0ABD3HL11_9MARC
MGRSPCCDKANVNKGPWSPDEDALLKNFIEENGTGGNWITLPSKAGLRRCGKSCRLRWINYLRPDIKRGSFTEEEDQTIYRLHAQIGSRWSMIASHLPGRTDNDIKNYWNTRLKKKLWDSSIYNVYRNLNSYPSTPGQTYRQLGLPDYGGISAAQASSLQLTQNSFEVNQEPQYYSYYNQQQQQHLFPQHPVISAPGETVTVNSRSWTVLQQRQEYPGPTDQAKDDERRQRLCTIESSLRNIIGTAQSTPSDSSSVGSLTNNCLGLHDTSSTLSRCSNSSSEPNQFDVFQMPEMLAAFMDEKEYAFYDDLAAESSTTNMQGISDPEMTESTLLQPVVAPISQLPASDGNSGFGFPQLYQFQAPYEGPDVPAAWNQRRMA